jgi:BirA family transcriptional regulator, biotin operon repressor / biotin---[acetyl-CoA-carboxylase] ligase
MNAPPLPRELADPLARLSPRLRQIGHEVRWFPEVTSTNDVAALLADQGAPEGCVVVADAQTSGRGRAGRTWWSPPGAGLYVSLVLRPRRDVIPLLTLAAGIAAAEGIEAATALDVQLKWPNDLQIGDRKLGGILAESRDGLRHVIVGVGINVRQASYPPELSARATSIESELGRPADRGLVLGECLAALASRYQALCHGGASEVVAAWRVRAARSLDRAVEWDEDGTRRAGRAEGVADDGALLIRTPEGLVRVTSGEVRWGQGTAVRG